MATFNPGAGRGRANKVQVRIEGLKELQSSLKKMSSKSDSVMTRQIHLAADRIARRAIRDVPVDTGKLLGSVNVKKGNRYAEARADANYAMYVEKGTRYMKAQPYFFKHVEESIRVLMKNIKRLTTL